MNLEGVKRTRVKKKKRRRVGRGPGSGWGTTAGRGHKGAGQRSGFQTRLHFEGGQMPLYRRLPKKGFSNARFQVRLHVVNTGDLDRVFQPGEAVDLERVKAVGLAPKKARFLKILGWGDLSRALHVRAHAVSRGAREKVEGAGGTVEILAVRPAPRPKGVKKRQRERAAPESDR